MKRFTLTLMIWILAPWAGVKAEEWPSATGVLENFVAAVGGERALAARDSIRFTGIIVEEIEGREPSRTSTPFRAVGRADGSLRYAESETWSDLPAVDTGEPSKKLRWLMHPRFALVLPEFFPGLEVVRREARDGRPFVVMVPAVGKFAHDALYFEESSGLLQHLGYFIDLRDWRPEGGVLFPHEIVFSRKGGHTTYRFDKVQAFPAPGR